MAWQPPGKAKHAVRCVTSERHAHELLVECAAVARQEHRTPYCNCIFEFDVQDFLPSGEILVVAKRADVSHGGGVCGGGVQVRWVCC